MRTFLREHWKALAAIVLLVVLALFTVNPGAALPEPSLASRLRTHARSIAAGGHDAADPATLQAAARYIENVLKTDGYAIRRREAEAGKQAVRSIEVSVANVAPGARPSRIFIVGASRIGQASGSGAAAVLELARLLKKLRPSQGTEVKFVFFIDEDRTPHMGNFIAFVGTLESSRLVQDALSAFRAVSDIPAHGLAAPAYVQGVTLSNHSSFGRAGAPAIVITDTGFMRYPYYKMHADDGAEDTPDKFDYEDSARVVQGLARTITALAAGAQG